MVPVLEWVGCLGRWELRWQSVMSVGDGGGFGSGSRSSSSAEFSEWCLREAEGSDVVTGTLQHSDNFTR